MLKGRNKKVSMLASVGIGITIGILATLAGGMLLAFLTAGEQVKISSVGIGALLIQLAASFLGALAASALATEKRLISCICAAAGYYLLLLATTALAFGGEYGHLLIGLLMVLLGCAAAVLLTTRGKKGATKRRHTRVYR